MKTAISCLMVFALIGSVHADEVLLQQSREAAKDLGRVLKSELMAAMRQGGPLLALQVCNQQAPGLGRAVAVRHGLQVRRTSLKTRNPANHPDDWERKVLQQFEQRKADGESLKTMEYSETTNHRGGTVFRYMKAIGTAPPCLACHGDNIDPKLGERIRQLYPQDKATGFQPGDIRGAFTVIKRL